MHIAIDFDGTCTSHEFPAIGKDIGAVPVLKELVAKGHELILFTMRSDIESPESDHPDIHPVGGNYLSDAVAWFVDNEIPLCSVQKNPTQHTWTHSPKCYAQLYIDDAALGCPLNFNPAISKRPFVNWIEVRRLLIAQQIL